MNPNRLPANCNLGPVHLTVADLSRSVAFYEERLGLRTQERAGDTAVLGAGAAPLLRLTAVAGARHATGHSGLYHFALLLPSRADLGAALGHLRRTQTPLSGGADHLVSEALYLSDPDGNGIELYRDRSRAEWRVVDGRLQMDTLPLDLQGLLAAAGTKMGQATLPPATAMGHIHLHVGDLEEALRFYQDAVGFDLQLRFGPAAAFLSFGGYHHHLGLNTWAGVGAPPQPEGAAGLRTWELRLPDAAALAALRARLAAAEVGSVAVDGRLLLRDPSGNGLLVSIRP